MISGIFFILLACKAYKDWLNHSSTQFLIWFLILSFTILPESFCSCGHTPFDIWLNRVWDWNVYFTMRKVALLIQTFTLKAGHFIGADWPKTFHYMVPVCMFSVSVSCISSAMIMNEAYLSCPHPHMHSSRLVTFNPPVM